MFRASRCLLAACALMFLSADVSGSSEEETAGFEDEAQTEFYLPYSETEDVDFHIVKSGAGCYQWSTNNTDVIRLEPIYTDSERQCGKKLEFQILPSKCTQKTTIKVVAENLDLDAYDANADVTAEYLLHVHPVSKLEVLGLKTEMVAGSDPVPFGVAGYDDNDNEFDTLDGLQISWFVGSKREVAIFENHRQIGPIVKVVPMSAGKGALMAVLEDSNYQNLEPAIKEFSVTAPLLLEPDGVFLLEGAKAHFTLYERAVNENREKVLNALDVSSEEADYRLEIKEPEYAVLDAKSGNVTALKEGETTLFVRNAEGDIVKGVPVRITTASSLKVTVFPDTEQTQLILGHEYDIRVDIYNGDDRLIHPSENILCKTTFPRQFDIVDVSENGLRAKIRTVAIGIGKIKASLRSVVTEDDEELEIMPHVKGSTDFEVYESVVIKPRETILPWDENKKPEYELRFQASGGGKVYTWSSDKPELGTVDSEGQVTTHGGPGMFTVKAAMIKGSQNSDQSKVYILPVTDLEFKVHHQETATHTPITLALRMLTVLEGEEDPVMFSDCADVPYTITLSDNKNFELDQVHGRGQNRAQDACASFSILAKTPGTTCKVTVSYTEPSTGKQFKASTHISAHKSLEVDYPRNEHRMPLPEVILAVGSSYPIILSGGPTPWISKPSAHYKQVEVDDPEIARVKRIPDEEVGAKVLTGSYVDVHAYTVTCLALGNTTVAFMIGNTASSTNPSPTQSVMEVLIKCDVPHKLVVKAEPKKSDAGVKFAANPKTSRIMAPSNRDVVLDLNVKNAQGRSFHDVSSIQFSIKASDESLLKAAADVVYTREPVAEHLGKLTLPGRPSFTFSPHSKKGAVGITATVADYRKEVLAAEKIANAPTMPKISDDDSEDDEDIEDVEEYERHHHSLRTSLEFELVSADEIDAVLKK